MSGCGLFPFKITAGLPGNKTIRNRTSSTARRVPEGASVVRDGVLHGEATEGTNREGHGSLQREAYCRRVANYGARVDWRECLYL
jgi:hypothetical protein